MLELLALGFVVWGVVLLLAVDKIRHWNKQAAKELVTIRKALVKEPEKPAEWDGWS